MPASTTTTPFAPRTDVLVDPLSFGRPYSTEVPGVLTFRGNPTRSYYGTGPMPRSTPQVLWQYPGAGNPMCGQSSEYGNVRTWCGTGWTGQPAVFEREGRTWVVFGAYDWKVHFVDAGMVVVLARVSSGESSLAGTLLRSLPVGRSCCADSSSDDVRSAMTTATSDTTAIAATKAAGLTEKLVGFEVTDKAIARDGWEVIGADGAKVGRVTSASPSPTLGRNVGLAYLPVGMSELGTALRLRDPARGREAAAVVVKTPFYKRAR